MQLFQMEDGMVVSHKDKKATINWASCSVPKEWRANIYHNNETISNEMLSTKEWKLQSQTTGRTQGKTLSVKSYLCGDEVGIVVQIVGVGDWKMDRI